MASITDPIVTNFVDNRLRPVAERLEAIRLRFASDKSEWDTTVQAALSAFALADEVDNRTAEGLVPITRSELNTFLTNYQAIDTAITAAITELQKLTVNPPTIT